MKSYPATTLATIVALIVVAAALVLVGGPSSAEDQRTVTILGIIGLAVTTILSTNRGEASTHAARRADEGVQQAKETLAISEGARAAMSEPAMRALTRLVEATDRAERAAEVVEKAANGHTTGELHTRADDSPAEAGG